MKRFAFLTAFCLALMAVPASAQVSLYGGGGGAFPQGDDLDGIDGGLQLFGGADIELNERLSVYVEGQWGTHSTDVDGVDVKPAALMGGLLIGLSSGDGPTPYIFGGAGLQSVTIEASNVSVDDSAIGIQLGAGVSFPLGSFNGFAEGRFQRAGFADDADVLPDLTFSIISLAVGLSIDLGGS